MVIDSTVKDQVSDEEWQVRVDLAACYRAIALYGWDDLVFTHASARVPGGERTPDVSCIPIPGQA